MASVHDIAATILRKAGPLPAMKLQRLVYYSQAWSLAWDDRPLFTARIEAWANGPIVPALYALHRGHFTLTKWPQGDPGRLSSTERETIDAVLAFYGPKNSQWLSDLARAEAPWREARRGLAPGERGQSLINHAAMHEYYSGIEKPPSNEGLVAWLLACPVKGFFVPIESETPQDAFARNVIPPSPPAAPAARRRRKPRKVRMQRASASEILAALGP